MGILCVTLVTLVTPGRRWNERGGLRMAGRGCVTSGRSAPAAVSPYLVPGYRHRHVIPLEVRHHIAQFGGQDLGRFRLCTAQPDGTADRVLAAPERELPVRRDKHSFAAICVHREVVVLALVGQA